ncbi:MAG: hypothetical protein QOJ63_223 [Solirubrobacteraceae bacterium]|jgi:SAM-dependent methyltransferase|nr:hypothetical protein [Solirubrobacteraceae bacterium]
MTPPFAQAQLTTEPDVAPPAMPYMDALLADVASGDDETKVLWQRHLHWGYWSDPETATGTNEDYAAAAEAMAQQLIDAAGIRDGMRVLDCGCGVGGMVATLNERFRDMRLVGLNVDGRQLEIARERVIAQPGNTVEFVEADACKLPFPADSFDVVLAVECIFHFPGRRRFFRQAARVLDNGGTLALSDFVPPVAALPLLLPLNWSLPFFGEHNRILLTDGAYRVLASDTGFDVRVSDDITRNTLPSYHVLMRYYGGISPAAFKQSRLLARLSRFGLLRYRILAFAADQ